MATRSAGRTEPRLGQSARTSKGVACGAMWDDHAQGDVRKLAGEDVIARPAAEGRPAAGAGCRTRTAGSGAWRWEHGRHDDEHGSISDRLQRRIGPQQYEAGDGQPAKRQRGWPLLPPRQHRDRDACDQSRHQQYGRLPSERAGPRFYAPRRPAQGEEQRSNARRAEHAMQRPDLPRRRLGWLGRPQVQSGQQRPKQDGRGKKVEGTDSTGTPPQISSSGQGSALARSQDLQSLTRKERAALRTRFELFLLRREHGEDGEHRTFPGASTVARSAQAGGTGGEYGLSGFSPAATRPAATGHAPGVAAARGPVSGSE